jgi:hypothetical protein
MRRIGMIKSREMRRTGHVTLHEREEECIQGFGVKVRKKESTRTTQM